jgi:hypothetical protein
MICMEIQNTIATSTDGDDDDDDNDDRPLLEA